MFIFRTFRFSQFASVVLCLLLLGCGNSEHSGAVGSNHEITVFANLDRNSPVGTRLSEVFARPLEVVGKEPAFRLDFVTLKKFGVHKLVKQQIVAVDMSRRDQLAQRTRDWLSGRDSGLLEQREPFRLIVQDLWASGQTTLFLVAWSEAELLALMDDSRGDMLYRELEASAARGLTKTLFALGESKEISANLARDCGWTMKLVPGFFVAEDPVNQTVKLNADEPVRLILVAWKDEQRPLDRAEWEAWMNEVMFRLNDGDFIEPSLTQVFTTEFQGEPALKWEGVWQNEKYVIGGPMRAYGFVRGSRSFCLIGQVYAPGNPKVNTLRQLEGLFMTFEVIQ